VRDFKGLAETNGHPDFEKVPTGGYGHYLGQAQDQLDADGKPVFASTGYKVLSEGRDAQGRNILTGKSYIFGRSGDVAGIRTAPQGGSTPSADRFRQWYRDTPGVNVSMPLAITLRRQAGTNVYSFNDRTDPAYSTLGGFFPIDRQLFGNFGSSGHNFHFSF